MFGMFGQGGVMPQGNPDQVRIVHPAQIKEWMDADEAVVIDVREVNEYVQAHIPGSILMPLSSFDPAKVPDVGEKKLVIHCRSGNRCGMASMKLLSSGYEGVINRMQGGLFGWHQIGGPLAQGMPG